MTPEQQKYYQQLGELRRPLSPPEQETYQWLMKMALEEARQKANKLTKEDPK